MFQTEPIKFLQSFSTEWLTDLLLFVSQLGYSSFYIPVLILITFGVDFRKGFLLTQMMLWVGLLTELLKNLIALPRPADVDSGVRLLEGNIPSLAPFSSMGGRGFWDLPDAEAIRIIRSQPEWSFGIPSGHVSGTVTFWGGLSLVFRPTAMKVAALVMVILMPVSRMYLGRHFLADVLAGFLLAAGLLAVAHFFFVRPENHGRLLTLVSLRRTVNSRVVGLVIFMLAAPIVLLTLSPLIEPENAGHLLGLNVAFVVLAMTGLPEDAASWLRRISRVGLAFALYAGAAWFVALLVEATLTEASNSWVEFLIAAIPAFVALWGGVRANLGLGLYTKKA